MKRTMTILGDNRKNFPEFMEILMKQNIRLLIVSKDEVRNAELISRFQELNADSEIEFTSCERDGCWEADIITINEPNDLSHALLERIKEVATQKIVLGIFEHGADNEISGLEKALPNSKVIMLQVDSQKKEFLIFGRNSEAKNKIQQLLANAGYKIQNEKFI